MFALNAGTNGSQTQTKGTILMGKKIRGDKICIVCKLHTEQILTKKGWVCKQCKTLQKENK